MIIPRERQKTGLKNILKVYNKLSRYFDDSSEADILLSTLSGMWQFQLKILSH